MVRPLNNLLCLKHNVRALVQLGGLEPPTSCSTDRRSNQLSYNCILWEHLKTRCRTGRKLGATGGFGKAGSCPTSGVSATAAHPGVTQKPKPERPARAWFETGRAAAC